MLSRFQEQGWDSKPYERMLQLADADAGELVVLVLSAIERLPRPPTFVDAALSLIDLDGLAAYVERAVRWLAQHPGRDTVDTPAESVVAYASLQDSFVLTDHLRDLWALAPNRAAYYAEWPWRAADEQEAQRLLHVLRAGSTDDRVRAWHALLQTRQPQHLRAALDAVGDATGLPHAEPEAFLRHVGWTIEDGDLRRLAPDICLHLQLPPESLTTQLSNPAHLHPANHPTWFGLGQPSHHAQIGGVAGDVCGRCAKPLHRLLTLDDVPQGLGVSSRPALELLTCLSCVAWADPALFYGHDSDGTAHPVERLEKPVAPDLPAEPLRAAQVGLVPTPKRWRWQDWGLANGRENLNRLGGEPTWIQNAAYLPCPRCRRLMTALLQLDSFLTTEDDGELYWGSGGLGYVLWCDNCAISGVTAQWT